MITIDFEGFFQCRLATDSDVYNHPRGQNGWTFAYANEPDMDRIIRFWDPVGARTHSPIIGVEVTAVNGDRAHALSRARVELDPMAVFEGRNGTIASSTTEPIAPCSWKITKGSFTLMRRSDYNVQRIVERQPYMGQGLIDLPLPDVRGVSLSTPAEALAFRATRKHALTADLATATDTNERTILTARIAALTSINGGAPIATMFSAVPYEHPLKDAAVISDPAGMLGSTPDTGRPWSVQYWMGSFDADTHTAYAKGTMSVTTL